MMVGEPTTCTILIIIPIWYMLGWRGVELFVWVLYGKGANYKLKYLINRLDSEELIFRFLS